MNVKIYHNPRCSKSREALKLLEEKGIQPEIVEYLKTPLNVEQLQDLLRKLSLKPRDLMRIKEPEYKENILDDEALSDAELIAAMVKFPKLMERPVVVVDDKAVIGRPAENILAIL